MKNKNLAYTVFAIFFTTLSVQAQTIVTCEKSENDDHYYVRISSRDDGFLDGYVSKNNVNVYSGQMITIVRGSNPNFVNEDQSVGLLVFTRGGEQRFGSLKFPGTDGNPVYISEMLCQ